MRWEAYNFTDDFQDAVLACLITYPDEFYGFGHIIRPAYFNGPTAVEVVHRLQEYIKKYEKFPNFSVLGNFAFDKASRISVDHAKEVIEYVEKISKVDISDWKAIRDLCVEFAQERAIYDGIRKIHAAQSEGKKETINPAEIMRTAMMVGTNINDLGLSLYHDSDKVVDTVMSHTYGVQTGYAEFDKLWKMGWGPGWLIVPLAPPKRYKTTFCINLALNMAGYAVKRDVLYYACEITQELAMMRALYNISHLKEEEVRDSPQRAKERIKEKLVEKMWGNVWFKGFPSKTVTISQIREHARHVVQTYGLKPKAIVIDYAETVKPDIIAKDTPDWRQQADIYVQARAFGSDMGCCVIMPDRCNKETVGRKVPSMKSFQGSFEKAGVVDVAIGLCATDEELLQNRMRYFVFLNRHGKDLMHYEGKLDREYMKMTVENQIDYDPEEADKQDKETFKGRRRRRPSEDVDLTQLDD